MIVVEVLVENAAVTVVVVWGMFEVLVSNLTTVVSLYCVTNAVEVGLVIVDHVVVGWPHVVVDVR